MLRLHVFFAIVLFSISCKPRSDASSTKDSGLTSPHNRIEVTRSWVREVLRHITTAQSYRGELMFLAGQLVGMAVDEGATINPQDASKRVQISTDFDEKVDGILDEIQVVLQKVIITYLQGRSGGQGELPPVDAESFKRHALEPAQAMVDEIKNNLRPKARDIIRNVIRDPSFDASPFFLAVNQLGTRLDSLQNYFVSINRGQSPTPHPNQLDTSILIRNATYIPNNQHDASSRGCVLEADLEKVDGKLRRVLFRKASHEGWSNCSGLVDNKMLQPHEYGVLPYRKRHRRR